MHPITPATVDILAVYHCKKRGLVFADGQAVQYKWRNALTIQMGEIAAQVQTATFGAGCMGPNDTKFMAEGYLWRTGLLPG